MKQWVRQCTAAAVLAVVLAGCAVGHAPVTAAITWNERGPVSAGSAPTGSKVGRSSAWGIIVLAMGDASISAAMANGGIARVHHVDHETLNILGVYSRYTTIVYGE